MRFTITFSGYAERVLEEINDTVAAAEELAACKIEGPMLANMPPGLLDALPEGTDVRMRIKSPSGEPVMIGGVAIHLSGFGPKVCGKAPKTVAQRKAIQRAQEEVKYG